MNIINGKLLAEKIKDQVAKEVFDLCSNPANTPLCERRPSLAIILVGARPDSELYVNLKQKTAATVGIDTSLYKLDENASEEELLSAIKFLNSDEMTDGILIQLPLPEHLDTDKIVNTISAEKDVDGFHPENIQKIKNINSPLNANSSQLLSPVFQSILACLEEAKFDLKNKTAAIVAKPGIFTDSLDKLLENLGAEVATIQPNEVGSKTSTADLVITAVGQADLINADDIKDDAVLIDIGICKDEEGKTCGDVNAESVKDKAGWLTPVPGGIGPLTIAFALKNTLEFFKKNKIKN